MKKKGHLKVAGGADDTLEALGPVLESVLALMQ